MPIRPEAVVASIIARTKVPSWLLRVVPHVAATMRGSMSVETMPAATASSKS